MEKDVIGGAVGHKRLAIKGEVKVSDSGEVAHHLLHWLQIVLHIVCQNDLVMSSNCAD